MTRSKVLKKNKYKREEEYLMKHKAYRSKKIWNEFIRDWYEIYSVVYGPHLLDYRNWLLIREVS